MKRSQILSVLAQPGAYIECLLWHDYAYNNDRFHWICDTPGARPWLRVPGRCVARLRSFTVERLVEDGTLKAKYPEQSGYRTFVLANPPEPSTLETPAGTVLLKTPWRLP